MSDKKHWITKLVPVLAFAAGIIMASIGGVITTSSALKLAFFESGSYSYISKDQCMYDYNRSPAPIANESGLVSGEIDVTIHHEKPYQRTEAEIEECMNEKRAEEKSRFQKSEKQDIVDGVSSLVVGAILILAFRRRK